MTFSCCSWGHACGSLWWSSWVSSPCSVRTKDLVVIGIVVDDWKCGEDTLNSIGCWVGHVISLHGLGFGKQGLQLWTQSTLQQQSSPKLWWSEMWKGLVVYVGRLLPGLLSFTELGVGNRDVTLGVVNSDTHLSRSSQGQGSNGQGYSGVCFGGGEADFRSLLFCFVWVW